MNTTLLYIHGLASDRFSRKFQDLQTYFGTEFNYDFLEWNNDSNIANLIQQMHLKYTNQPLIIVGDSTGANFAYQLRQLRNNPNDKLILTSPLLTIDKRIADFEFPQSLVQYLKKITEPENCLIIATTKDEILDQNWISENFEKFNKVNFINVEDNHRLQKFDKYLDEIQKYII